MNDLMITINSINNNSIMSIDPIHNPIPIPNLHPSFLNNTSPLSLWNDLSILSISMWLLTLLSYKSVILPIHTSITLLMESSQMCYEQIQCCSSITINTTLLYYFHSDYYYFSIIYYLSSMYLTFSLITLSSMSSSKSLNLPNHLIIGFISSYLLLLSSFSKCLSIMN